jgi:hypothetical protein
MPRRKSKPHELTTEEALRKMFPLKVREHVKQEAQKARKIGPQSNTKRKAT